MRVMVFGKAAAGREGAPPTVEALAAIDVTMDALAKAGILVTIGALAPTA